jgi:hypothetical protein
LLHASAAGRISGHSQNSQQKEIPMPPLDGKEVIKPVPFDAHEQIARVQHEEAPKQPGYAHSGLQAVDAEEAVTEYPKAVDHVDHPSGVGFEPVVVKSAEEEKQYLGAKAADEAGAAEPAPREEKTA